MSPLSFFPTGQRFLLPNHMTSGFMSPRSLFSHWSAVAWAHDPFFHLVSGASTGSDVTGSSSGHVIALGQSEARTIAIWAPFTTSVVHSRPRFHSYGWVWIPDSTGWIPESRDRTPNSKSQDSGFQRQKNVGFRIPLHGAKSISRSTVLHLKRTNFSKSPPSRACKKKRVKTGTYVPGLTVSFDPLFLC